MIEPEETTFRPITSSGCAPSKPVFASHRRGSRHRTGKFLPSAKAMVTTIVVVIMAMLPIMDLGGLAES